MLCKPQTLVSIGEAVATGPTSPFHSLSLSSPLGRCSALSPASPTAFPHSLIPTSYILQGNSPEALFPCPPQLPPTHPSHLLALPLRKPLTHCNLVSSVAQLERNQTQTLIHNDEGSRDWAKKGWGTRDPSEPRTHLGAESTYSGSSTVLSFWRPPHFCGLGHALQRHPQGSTTDRPSPPLH